MDDKEFFWDCLKHEDTLFTNRGNFFLLAESFLFAGMIALISSNCYDINQKFTLPLISLGILISLIWLYSGAKQIISTERIIKNELKSLDRRWKYLSSSRSNWHLKIHHLIGIILPIAFFIAWVYLFNVCCINGLS